MLLVTSPAALQGAASAVPEPTGLILFIVGILIVIWVLVGKGSK